MKTVSLLAVAAIALAACRQVPAPSPASALSTGGDSVALLNDAAHLCQNELQGTIAFKQTEGEIRLYCQFSDGTEQSREADAVHMLQEFAQGMVKGDSL